ncbi:MAG: long-chain fatty acid--CoA ligase [Rhodomicrobium sp.]|nr:long-chain fatty acid--CoA ligase [Rhodomicrobium sp.]
MPSFLDSAAARFGGNLATDFFGKLMTYAELARQVNRAAKGLRELGVTKGTRAGLLLPNCPAFIVYYYAILKAGGIVVNFNPLYAIPELIQQAKDADVRLMVTLDLKATFPKVEALLEAGVLERAIAVPFQSMLPMTKALLFRALKSGDVASSWSAVPGVVSSRDLQNNDGRFEAPAIDVNEIAVLQYTGGTTGTPKGAMLTHSNLSINVQQAASWFPGIACDGDERFFCVIPFFHVFAMTSLMNFAIAKAGQLIMLPRFELKQALKIIDKTKPTIMAGVPTLFNALAKAPDIKQHDLSSLKFCISGGAPLPIEVKREFERVSGCKLVEGYGLSETSPVTHINPPSGPVKEGSIGLPVPGTIISLRSLDAPEQEVPLGEKGEICISGPQVMKGYWNKAEETAQAFTGEFFRTGDVAYMDSEGFTYIVDRIKDLIICSGFNVYPRRIEEAIYEHPAVQEVTVIGVPDQYRGEAPKAYIKLRTNHRATVDELMQFLSSRISKIEMPSEIEFRDELPKTLIGKLSKKELKAENNKRPV